MTLPNDKKALQDRLSRVATRMAQKFGNGVFNGVTVGAGACAGIPVSVLMNRIAGKKVIMDSIGSENPSALSFSIVDLGSGITATTGEQLIAQTYISSKLPTGFYGSPAALVMLAKLKAGVDSVDIHVVGDSNTGSSPSGNWGYSRGLARGLIAGCCASMYATPVYPAGICYGSGSSDLGTLNLGFRNYSNLTAVNKTTNGNTWGNGSQAPDDVKSFFNVFGTDLGFGSPGGNASPVTRTSFVWAFREGFTYNSNEENYISAYVADGTEAQYGIKTTNALTYRVVHSLLPGNGASAASVVLYFGGASASSGYCAAANALKTYTFADGSATSSVKDPYGNNGFTYYPPAGSANGLGARYSAYAGVAGATAKTVSKLTWGADAARTGVTIAYAWGAKQSGFTMTYGPYAVYLESVHSNSKGWAITPVAYLSGYTTGGIANNIANFGATTGAYNNSALKTVLQETRERQIEAGGSGNVLVWLNSGVNDASQLTEATAAAQYKGNIRSIVSTYRSAWRSLDYPESDLAFMVSTTHPVDTGDASLDTVRAKGVEYASTPVDANAIDDPYYNVLFVNFEELGLTYGTFLNGNSFNSNNTFYRDSGNPHLTVGTTGGYDYVSEVIMKKCLRYNVSY